jgi:hypothetical protein
MQQHIKKLMYGSECIHTHTTELCKFINWQKHNELFNVSAIMEVITELVTIMPHEADTSHNKKNDLPL